MDKHSRNSNDSKDHESFLNGDRIILMDMIKHSQITQSNKFAIFLQYLKNEVMDEVHFLHAGK